MEAGFIVHYAHAFPSSCGVVRLEKIRTPRFQPHMSRALAQISTCYSRLRMSAATSRNDDSLGCSTADISTWHPTHSDTATSKPFSALMRSPASVFALPLAVVALTRHLVAEIAPLQTAMRLRARAVEIVEDHVTRLLLRDVRAELLLAESHATATAATLLHAESALRVAVAHADELQAQLSALTASEHGMQHADHEAHEKGRLLSIAELELERERSASRRLAEEIEYCSSDLHQKQAFVSERLREIANIELSLHNLEVGMNGELSLARARIDDAASQRESLLKELRAVIRSNEEVQSLIRDCTDTDGVDVHKGLDETLAALQAVRSEFEDPPPSAIVAVRAQNVKLKKELVRVEEELDGMREYLQQLDEDAAIAQRLSRDLRSRENSIADLRAKIADAEKQGLTTRALEFDVSSRFTLTPRVFTGKTDADFNTAKDKHVNTDLATDNESRQDSKLQGPAVRDVTKVMYQGADAVRQSPVPISFEKTKGVC